MRMLIRDYKKEIVITFLFILLGVTFDQLISINKRLEENKKVTNLIVGSCSDSLHTSKDLMDNFYAFYTTAGKCLAYKGRCDFTSVGNELQLIDSDKQKIQTRLKQNISQLGQAVKIFNKQK